VEILSFLRPRTGYWRDRVQRSRWMAIPRSARSCFGIGRCWVKFQSDLTWATGCEAWWLLPPGRGCLRRSRERVLPIPVRRASVRPRSGEEIQYSSRAPPACCHQQRGDSGRDNTDTQPRPRSDPHRVICHQNWLGGRRPRIPTRRCRAHRLSRRTWRWLPREFLARFPPSSGSSFREKHSSQLLHRAGIILHRGLDDSGKLSP
jgi:hypothetical protein